MQQKMQQKINDKEIFEGQLINGHNTNLSWLCLPLQNNKYIYFFFFFFLKSAFKISLHFRVPDLDV